MMFYILLLLLTISLYQSVRRGGGDKTKSKKPFDLGYFREGDKFLDDDNDTNNKIKVNTMLKKVKKPTGSDSPKSVRTSKSEVPTSLRHSSRELPANEILEKVKNPTEIDRSYLSNSKSIDNAQFESGHLALPNSNLIDNFQSEFLSKSLKLNSRPISKEEAMSSGDQTLRKITRQVSLPNFKFGAGDILATKKSSLEKLRSNSLNFKNHNSPEYTGNDIVSPKVSSTYLLSSGSLPIISNLASTSEYSEALKRFNIDPVKLGSVSGDDRNKYLEPQNYAVDKDNVFLLNFIPLNSVDHEGTIVLFADKKYFDSFFAFFHHKKNMDFDTITIDVKHLKSPDTCLFNNSENRKKVETAKEGLTYLKHYLLFTRNVDRLDDDFDKLLGVVSNSPALKTTLVDDSITPVKIETPVKSTPNENFFESFFCYLAVY